MTLKLLSKVQLEPRTWKNPDFSSVHMDACEPPSTVFKYLPWCRMYSFLHFMNILFLLSRGRGRLASTVSSWSSPMSPIRLILSWRQDAAYRGCLEFYLQAQDLQDLKGCRWMASMCKIHWEKLTFKDVSLKNLAFDWRWSAAFLSGGELSSFEFWLCFFSPLITFSVREWIL